MNGMIGGLIKHRKSLSILLLFLCAAMVFLMLQVKVNYDMTKYLPQDSPTKQGIDKLNAEFSFPGTASVMVEDVSISEAVRLKKQIAQVDGVSSVLWLDDLADVTKPLAVLGSATTDAFYKDRAALFTVQFTEDDYSLKTGDALVVIREIIGEKGAIVGTAESNRLSRELVMKEIMTCIIVVVPLCAVLLMIAAHSWIEPFIYLLCIGIAIALNMGTNVIFGEISYITQSMAALLQLAVSLDYSIFLMHRYLEELDGNGGDVDGAIISATKKAITSISASSLTTIAGFLALVFMQYAIGADIGFVLAKGVAFSLLCCIFVMPMILKFFSGVINRTRHKPILRTFDGLGKAVMKLRWPLLILALLLVVPAYNGQARNNFIYGENAISSGSSDTARIEEHFELSNQMLIIVPKGSIAKEAALAEDLSAHEAISSVQGLTTLVDPAMPRQLLPQAVRSNFESETSVRMILSMNITSESPEMFAAVSELQAICDKYYAGQWHMAGLPSSLADIRETVTKDNVVVSWLSIVAVALIILFSFQSFSLPILLVTVIQLSIWINMSVPYYTGISLSFIGYLVVSAIQLGATIDYAILMSDRYLEYRDALMPPKEAASAAVKSAGGSILISCFVLTIAGFGEYFVSSIPSVSEIGMLIGRGALLSGVLVLALVPPILCVCDKLIQKTGWSKKKKQPEERPQETRKEVEAV
ncbi:MAG: RND transporter [Clostridiales bacterium]|nr:RND transporter [Clostridiales bacterium]